MRLICEGLVSSDRAFLRAWRADLSRAKIAIQCRSSSVGRQQEDNIEECAKVLFRRLTYGLVRRRNKADMNKLFTSYVLA